MVNIPLTGFTGLSGWLLKSKTTKPRFRQDSQDYQDLLKTIAQEAHTVGCLLDETAGVEGRQEWEENKHARFLAFWLTSAP
jgi:hypothetical protein